MPSLAFTADSRQTEAGRLYNRSEEDETRIPLQKAIDDADYEHGHRVNELDFLTAFRSPVAVARKSNCAFNTVRVSSTGRPWIVDNDSRGGDDEHAQPNAELATELTGQTMAEGSTFAPRRTSRPLSALLLRHHPSGPGGTSRTGAAAGTLPTVARLQQAPYSRSTHATLQQQGPVDLYYPPHVSPMHHGIVVSIAARQRRLQALSSCPSTTARRVTQRWSS